MCGFCGFVNSTIENKDLVLKNMMDSIAHRGPDSSGEYTDNTIAMGFRRLSFLDLEAGAQPLYNEDGRYALTFNGEIYNYQEIREKLIEAGHVFKTHTDSEVPTWLRRIRERPFISFKRHVCFRYLGQSG